MIQPSDGQRRQQLISALNDLEASLWHVEWHDGYEIKRVLEQLIRILKGDDAV